jgi:AcrR family transcriptional regulator
MSTLALNRGRIIQKLKTREVLISTANELLKKGVLRSVEQAAGEAGVSKATAYRYFANLEALKREASLQLKSEPPDQLFKDLAPDDLEGRLARLVNYHFELFTKNETEFRLFLSSVIGESVSAPAVHSRGGRRIAMITEALEPLKGSVTKKEFNHMVNALSLVFGIESITILKDLCGLNNKQVLENWKWTVGQIIQSGS